MVNLCIKLNFFFLLSIDPLELPPPAPVQVPTIQMQEDGVYSILSRSLRRLLSGNQAPVLQSPPPIHGNPQSPLTGNYIPPRFEPTDIYVSDCYMTRNGERLSSLQLIPSNREFDPGNYYQFLETIGCVGTAFATPIKSADWHKTTPLYAFDLSQNLQAYNTDWHPQSKMGLYRINVDFNEVQFS